MNRRNFLKGLAAAAAGSHWIPSQLHSAILPQTKSDALGELLPLRPFGKTGESLTLMGVGGMHAGQQNDATAQAIIEAALEGGIRYFDNAAVYVKGRAEEVYGRFLTPKYRDHIFLATKTRSENAAETRSQLETSLRRMNTDYLDLWLMHAVVSAEDFDSRVNEGVLEVMQQAVADKKVRYIGFSGHFTTAAHLHLLERLGDNSPMSACLFPVSPVDAVSADSFTEKVLPELVKKRYAPLAMKTMNAGRALESFAGKSIVPGRISFEENFWFTLSMPICSWLSGMTSVSDVKTNVGIARRFQSLTAGDREAIIRKVAEVADLPDLEIYKTDFNWRGRKRPRKNAASSPTDFPEFI